MNERTYPNLELTVFETVLPSGLTLLVCPRRGFARKCAYLTVDFGSMYRRFRLDGKERTLPMGTAHFLEHKIFDLPGRDVSGEFAALGADVNAFTGYDLTAYYFNCTDHFRRCLELLLEMVFTPYFTEETVEKERPIIAQEIGMNRDSPDTRGFEALARAMYRRHPIREPILGTLGSLGHITPETLALCHRAFYTPRNMVLSVMGDVDPEQVARLVEGELPGAFPAPAGKRRFRETMDIPVPETRQCMDVTVPQFHIGFKCEPVGPGAEGVFREAVGDLAAEALMGEGSRLYLHLLETGAIHPSFGGGFETLPDCGLLSASGDGDRGRQVRDAILAEGARLAREGVDPEEFARLKRSTLGRRIRGLDSFSSTCFRLGAYHLTDFPYPEFPDILSRVTREDLQAFLDRVVRPERCALSLILPKEEKT